jgi:WD40 repeat protein
MVLRRSFGLTTWALLSTVLVAAEPPSVRDVLGNALPAGAIVRMGNTHLVIVGSLKAITYSADGKWLATQADGGPINRETTTKVWDAITGAEIRRFRTGPLSRGSLFFLPNSSILMSGGQLCDMQNNEVRETVSERPVAAVGNSGRIIAIIEGKDEISFFDQQEQVQIGKIKVPIKTNSFQTMAFSSDGQIFAVSTYDGALGLWKPTAGRRLHDLSQPANAGASALSFSPDGKTLAAGGGNGSIRLFDTGSGKWQGSLEFPGFARSVAALAFSPDGAWLAASSEESAVRTWNTRTRRPGREFVSATPFREIHCLAFSPDGKRLAAGGSNQIRQWEFDSGREILQPSGLGYPIGDLLFAPDGHTLVSGSSTGIHQWETANGKLLHHVDKGYFGRLTFSADGWLLATSESGGYRVWETSSWNEIITLRPDGSREFRITASCLSPGIDRLCMGNDQGKVQMLELPAGKLIREITAVENDGVARLAVSPDNRTIAVAVGRQFGDDKARDRSIRLLETQSGQLLKTLSLPQMTNDRGDFSDLRFSDDGALVATVHSIVGLAIWTFPQGRQIAQLPAVSGPVVLSRDGGFAACCRAGEVIVVETATGEIAWTLPLPANRDLSPNAPFPHRVSRNSANIMAISPDQSILAIASAEASDPTILCWSMAPPSWKGRTPPAAVNQSTLEERWESLTKSNSPAAYEAIWTFTQSPDEAIALLKNRLTPAVRRQVNRERLKQLIAQLDAEAFQRREDAEMELAEMGRDITDELQKVLASKPSAEVESRITNLLRSLESQSIRYPSESIRRIRATRVLERIGTSQAAELLKMLATGDSAAIETQYAQRALDRLRSAGRIR